MKSIFKFVFFPSSTLDKIGMILWKDDPRKSGNGLLKSIFKYFINDQNQNNYSCTSKFKLIDFVKFVDK